MVIIPSIFGVTKDVEYYAELFVAQGALVYAMDPFWRDNHGPLRIPEDAAKAMARMNQVDDDMVLQDFLSTIKRGLADDKCNGKLILLGVCFGGRFVMKASQHLQPDGLAVWHGAGLPAEIVPERLSATEISLDFGAEDPLIPLSEVDALRTTIGHLNTSIRVHAECNHGFTHKGTDRCVPEAANAAARAVKDMIARLHTRESSKEG